MPGRELYLFIEALIGFLCGIYAITESLLRGFVALLDALGAFFQWFRNQVCGPLSSLPGIGFVFQRICQAVTDASNWVGGFSRDAIEWTFERILDLLAVFIWLVAYTGMSATWLVHQVVSRLFWFLLFYNQGSWKKQCIKIRLVIVRTATSPGILELASALSNFESKTREALEQCGIPRDQVVFSRWEFEEPENAEGVGFAANFFPIKGGAFSPRTFLWSMCFSSSLFEPTIFFVDRIHDPFLAGQALPVFTNYCLVEKNQIAEGGAPTRFVILVHELGHLCDIWPHAEEIERVMFKAPTDDDSRVFTRAECSFIRSSRFVEFVH